MTYDDREEELGFKLRRRQSRRVVPVLLRDLDFSDNSVIFEKILSKNKKNRN